LPTALAAAGIKPKPESHLDGVNLLPFLSGKNSGVPHKALYWRLGENMAIREGDWKLVKAAEGRLYDADSNVPAYLSGVELYNLKSDPGESKNLAAENAKRVKELVAAWTVWNKMLSKPLWGPGPRVVSTMK
jgi:arylsulfatase A-like enzyme